MPFDRLDSPHPAPTAAAASDDDAAPTLRTRCVCGQVHERGVHDDLNAQAALAAPLSQAGLENTLLRALLPSAPLRRRFLQAVGAGTARAAMAAILPAGTLGALEAMAQTAAPLEKKELKVGFIAITCATPLIMAGPLGFYRQQGLDVSLVKTAGWALIRDKMLNKEYDATHFLSPMPLATTMGLGSVAQPMRVATIQNINGQAITLANKHKENRDPKNWKGFKLAVPFEYSMHNFLLRYYLAEAGLDPDRDVQIRVVPPPEMVANLRAGNVDGYLGPDPFNQRAVYEEVGFIHILSKDIWDGHPCCAFGTSQAFIQQNPNTFAALYRSVLTAAAMAREAKNRELIAKVIAPAAYLNQPEVVLQQVLTGRFADGLGNIKSVPDRADFDPVPWQSMAVWMLTQMKRWGYIKGEVDYKAMAEQVFLLTDAKREMKALGQKVPDGAYRSYKVMGKTFDPTKPAEYAASFAIRRA